ncbi:MAG: imidazole glycerol phosphate synthase subunit HisH [Candidatus Woesearchaeota archaeon]|nr:imidazole glycerol phosphate synthase subunit HisH [Candidatus Woesearchaeota archaeon]
MIGIIDCGTGNLNSVKNALDYLRTKSKVVNTPEEIENADAIILPGVGAFGFVMDNLRDKGLEMPIRNSIKDGKPFLGICLGLQALFEESEESKGVKGLGIFKGKAVKFSKGKVPQVGWNKVIPTKKGIFRESYFYFVNSYYVVPEEKEIVAATTDYFGSFVSGIQYKNVAAVQFHPEKSGKSGLELLRRWLKCSLKE